MTIFGKCPVCEENATVKPELSTKEYKVFICENNHTFRKKLNENPEDDDKEIWDHLPEWARMFKHA